MVRDVDPLSDHFRPLIRHLDVILGSSFQEVYDGEILRKTDHPATEAVHFLMRYPDSRDSEAFRLWLDRNLSPKVGERIFGIALAIGSELRHIFVTAQKRHIAERTVLENEEQYSLSLHHGKEVRWDLMREHARELQSYLQAIAACAQQDTFVPTDLQRLILNALDGVAMTADALEAALGVVREALYDGRQRRGGLKELMDRGLVLHDRRAGCYYRPDALPRCSG